MCSALFRTRLVGGEPVVPVMALTTRIEPAVRRKDVRVALVVDTLLREPFTTPQRMALVPQQTPSEAEEALDTTDAVARRVERRGNLRTEG
jgi:ATP-dependent DNA helicase RecG